MIKGDVRTEKRSNLEPTEAQVRLKRREDVKRNSRLILRSLWLVLTKNRLLFWGGVVTFSVMLGAYLALTTPLWSTRTTLSQVRTSSLKNSKLLNGNLSLNGLQYQVARPVNILVMGIEPLAAVKDTSPESFSGSSDTMLLLRVDPNDKSMRLLSIPKDSQVVIPDVGLEKISLANPRGGPALAARVVSRTLNNVPIDRYIRLNTTALRELVNLMGGVEVFVPERMLYKDTAQKLEINLYPGWQTLNGEQAEQFVRFRNSKAGDLLRVQRQQILLKAVRDRLTSPAVLPRLPQLINMMQSYIDTNLSLEEVLALTNFCVGLEPENLQMVMLPGDLSPFSQDPNSYWLYPAGQDRIMSSYFGVNTGITQKPRSLNTLKVAVQNASGLPKLGQRVTNYLKQQGFNNVYVVPDWSDSQRQTEIIVQNGNLEAAAELRKVLGLGSIEASATGELNSQLTVRVGKDWNRDKPLFRGSKNNGWQWGVGSREQKKMMNDE